MEHTENMEVVRDRMLGPQSQETDSPDEMMDVETISAEAEGRDIPIDYSSAGGGTRDSDKLSYEGGYSRKMTRPEDVDRFSSRNQTEETKRCDLAMSQRAEKSNDGKGRGDAPQNWGLPAQSQGKLQHSHLEYADPSFLSRSAP